MKTLYNTVIIVIIAVPSPAFSQVNTHETTDGKSVSIGIGFPDYSKPFQAQIGLGIGPFPEYEGSDDYTARALPLLNIGKPNAYFLKGVNINTNNGLTSAGLTLLNISYSEGSNQRMQLLIGPLIRASR